VVHCTTKVFSHCLCLRFLFLSIPLIHHLCSIYHHGPPGGQAPRNSSISQVKARMITIKKQIMEHSTLDAKTIDHPLDPSISLFSVPNKLPPNHPKMKRCLFNGRLCRSPNSIAWLSSILVTAMPLPLMQNSDHIELDVQPFANTCNGQVQVKVQ